MKLRWYLEQMADANKTDYQKWYYLSVVLKELAIGVRGLSLDKEIVDEATGKAENI